MKRYDLATAAAVLSLGLVACGSGDSSSSSGGTTTSATTTVNNVQAVVVDSGPSLNGQPIGANDELFTTVTICVPGTSTCQSIDHVLVDTGSTGLRLLSSEITLNLPYVTNSSNNPIGNCVQYADTSYQWGPIVKVDVKMAGEVASSVPIQVVGAGSNFAAAPTSCSVGGTPAQTLLELGATGILGVGLFRQDCGPACASSSPPAVYYSCPSSGCTPASVALTSQLQNPVWMFQTDNNGLAVILPQVGASGAVSVSGSMIFGIGTQSNNSLGSAQAQAANENTGNFTTTFKGVAYTTSYIDSGSSGYFFLDSTTTGLPDCGTTGTGDANGYYCPSSPLSFTAITSGPNPNGSGSTVSANIAFSIANGLSLIDSPNTAFNNLGGPFPLEFDWGLPFFFGRTVFIGIEGQQSAAGTGPYWAY
ncbi:MAG: DUF3443 domain-containing protein [Acidobacteriota bacterium]|nr:DUF3443 domain-containing protein [Acidobacteriota bacterium]